MFEKTRLHHVTRRGTLALAVTALGLSWAGHARAEDPADYPQRVVRMIVPFAAGGSTDVLARLVAEGMGKHLGQRVIVENVPGAGGVIAGRRVIAGPADGYTLLIGNTGTLAANAGFYKVKPFDVPTDFAAIASVADAPQIVVVRNSLPVSNLDEFARYARENAAKLSFGAAGVGSGSYLGGVLLNEALGLNIQAVNYRGSGQVLNDIIGGHVDYMVDSSTAALPHVLAGAAKGIAVLQKDRIKAAPNVPSAGESKFPNLNYTIWNAIVVPKQTPPAIIAKISDSVRKTMQDPEFLRRIAELGLELPAADLQTPEGAQRMLKEEQARWLPLVAKLGVTLD